jgi:hypothetical protein
MKINPLPEGYFCMKIQSALLVRDKVHKPSECPPTSSMNKTAAT